MFHMSRFEDFISLVQLFVSTFNYTACCTRTSLFILWLSPNHLVNVPELVLWVE